jgi:hypothetical protein
MEEEIILRIAFLFGIICFVSTSCGIKGSPLPPESSGKRLVTMSLVELKN